MHLEKTAFFSINNIFLHPCETCTLKSSKRPVHWDAPSACKAIMAPVAAANNQKSSSINTKHPLERGSLDMGQAPTITAAAVVPITIQEICGQRREMRHRGGNRSDMHQPSSGSSNKHKPPRRWRQRQVQTRILVQTIPDKAAANTTHCHIGTTSRRTIPGCDSGKPSRRRTTTDAPRGGSNRGRHKYKHGKGGGLSEANMMSDAEVGVRGEWSGENTRMNTMRE